MVNVNNLPRAPAPRRDAAAPAPVSQSQHRIAAAPPSSPRRTSEGQPASRTPLVTDAAAAMPPRQTSPIEPRKQELADRINNLVGKVKGQDSPFESQRDALDAIFELDDEVDTANRADGIKEGTMVELKNRLAGVQTSREYGRLLTTPEADEQAASIHRLLRKIEQEADALPPGPTDRGQLMGDLFERIKRMRAQISALDATLRHAKGAGRISDEHIAQIEQTTSACDMRVEQANQKLQVAKRALLEQKIEALAPTPEARHVLEDFEKKIPEIRLAIDGCRQELQLNGPDADTLQALLNARAKVVVGALLIDQVDALRQSYATDGSPSRPAVPLERWDEVRAIVQNAARLNATDLHGKEDRDRFSSALQTLRAKPAEAEAEPEPEPSQEVVLARRNECRRLRDALDASIKAGETTSINSAENLRQAVALFTEVRGLLSAGLLDRSHEVGQLQRVSRIHLQAQSIQRMQTEHFNNAQQIGAYKEGLRNDFKSMHQQGLLDQAQLEQLNGKLEQRCRQLASHMSLQEAFRSTHLTTVANVDATQEQVAAGMDRTLLLIRQAAFASTSHGIGALDEHALIRQLESQSVDWNRLPGVKERVRNELWAQLQQGSDNVNAYAELKKQIELLQAAKLIEPGDVQTLTDPKLPASFEEEMVRLAQDDQAATAQMLLDRGAQRIDELKALTQSGTLMPAQANLAVLQTRHCVNQAVADLINHKFEKLSAACKFGGSMKHVPPPAEQLALVSGLISDFVAGQAVGSWRINMQADRIHERLQTEFTPLLDEAKASRREAKTKGYQRKFEALNQSRLATPEEAVEALNKAKKIDTHRRINEAFALVSRGSASAFSLEVVRFQVLIRVWYRPELLSPDAQASLSSASKSAVRSIKQLVENGRLGQAQAAQLGSQLEHRKLQIRRAITLAHQVNQHHESVFATAQTAATPEAATAGAIEMHERVIEMARQASRGQIGLIEQHQLTQQLAAQRSHWRSAVAGDEPIFRQMKASLNSTKVSLEDKPMVEAQIEWSITAGLITPESKDDLIKALRRAVAKRTLEESAAD